MLGGCIGPPAGLDVVLKREIPQLACNRRPVLKAGASNCAEAVLLMFLFQRNEVCLYVTARCKLTFESARVP
jgi:hypothetical protein